MVACSIRHALISVSVMVLAAAGCAVVAQQLAGPARAVPAVADASAAPTEAAALAIASRYRHGVDVTGEMSPTTQVSAQPDGRFKLVATAVPVRAKDGSGAWKSLDLSLHSAAGMLAPSVSASPVQFSAGGAGPMARVRAQDGTWVAQSWSAGALPAPSVSGASATYANVFAGVNLVLTATATGMSEVLVVASADAASNPALAAVSFAVSGAALTPVAGTGATGGISADPATASGATAATGSHALVSPSPVWWDSSQPGATAAGPGGAGLTSPVPDSVTAGAVTINAKAVAAQPGLTYPVFVDPSVQPGMLGWTYVDSAYPSQNYYNGAGSSDSYQHVGTVPANWSDDGRAHTTRSMWMFDVRGIAGTFVDSATFNATNVYSSNCNAREIDVWQTGGIDGSTTWNNQSFQAQLGTGPSFAYGYTGTGSTCRATGNVGWDVTGRVRDLAGWSYPILALGLKANNEADTLTWRKFANANVTVYFTHYPTQPAVWFSSCSRTAGLTTGDVMHGGDIVWSRNGLYFLSMQTDGNLVEYQVPGAFNGAGASVVWSTGTRGVGGDNYLILQTDGNLVMYSQDTGGSIWQSGTSGTAMRTVTLQDSGNFVGYDNVGHFYWGIGAGAATSNPATWETCYTNSNRPPILGTSTSPDGLNVTDYFWLYNSAGALVQSGQSATVASGSPGSWTPSTLSDGFYRVSVQACVNDNGNNLCSATETRFGFVVDTTIPQAPSVTVTGPVSHVASAPSGTVGVSQETVTITPTPGSNTWGVAYAVVPAQAQVVFPTNLACGTQQGGYTTVCGQIDQPIHLSVTVPDEHSVIQAYAFDLAGNARSNASTPVNLYANADYTGDSSSSDQGHSWTTDTGTAATPACQAAPILDSATAKRNLTTLPSGACWTSDSTAPAYNGTTLKLGTGNHVLSFAGTTGGAAKTSASMLIDTTHSFTVGTWVKPATQPGTYATVLAQQGSSFSGLYLQEVALSGGNFWRLCVWGQVPALPVGCAQSAQTVGSGWVFLAGVFDAADGLVMLYVSSTDQIPGPALGNFTPVGPAPSGAFLVGGAWSGGTAADPFAGSVLDPFAVQGVLARDQLAQAADLTEPADFTAPIAGN